jgi:hypothetical protein
LAAAWAVAIIGCGESGTTKSGTEKEFQQLYKQYSARFYEKMTTQAENMPPVQVTAEAARIWDEVFGPHKALVTKRIEEIIKDLDTCSPIQEDLYLEVASGSRVEPPADQPQGIVLRQFLWSPVGAAQMGLNNWLARLLQPNSFNMRSVMTANAGLFWEAIDRNLDHPRLCLRQGPMLFVVDLSRKDDYYQVDKVRWLRPKSLGPMAMPKPPEGQPGTALPTTPPEGTPPPTGGLPGTAPQTPPTTPPAGTAPATPPATTPPATIPPATTPPAEKPAAPPAEKPAGKAKG